MDKKEATHTKDIHGKTIRLGDICRYSKEHYPDDDEIHFEIVFEENAFRKKYQDWGETLTKPILDNVLEIEIIRE